MADRSIGDLPSIDQLQYDSLIPVEQNGEAAKMTGAQFAAYARDAAIQAIQVLIGNDIKY